MRRLDLENISPRRTNQYRAVRIKSYYLPHYCLYVLVITRLALLQAFLIVYNILPDPLLCICCHIWCFSCVWSLCFSILGLFLWQCFGFFHWFSSDLIIPNHGKIGKNQTNKIPVFDIFCWQIQYNKSRTPTHCRTIR